MSGPAKPSLPETKSGFVAIIGAPNAGKSTLVNALVGEKISIVTHKVQTTRFQVRGIAMIDNTQLVLVDTPGIFAPKDRLARSMVHAAWTGVDDAEAIVHVIDAPAAWRAINNQNKTAQDRLALDDTERVMAGLKLRERGDVYLTLNKIDQMERDNLLGLITHYSQGELYKEIFLISALNRDGVDDLASTLCAVMKPGPYLYPPDQAADIPMRLMAAEMTREKLYLRLHDELPYASMVETEKWTEKKDGSVRIDQVIYVKRSSQKPIVLGKGGATIKQIGAQSRREMQDWLGRKVHLFLFVKVREKWVDDPARYLPQGLEFDV